MRCSCLIAALVAGICQAHGQAPPAIDATTLRHKVLCGYQGWFRCPGDPADQGWLHWSRNCPKFTPRTELAGLPAHKLFELGDAGLVLAGLRIIFEDRVEAFEDRGLPVADELRLEVYLRHSSAWLAAPVGVQGRSWL